MRLDWTLSAYGRLCRTLLEDTRSVMPVRDFLDSRPACATILRHDVDRFPGNAIQMATLEAGLEIRSTYYVRVGRDHPDPVFLHRLQELGHEVGYHYEVLAKTNGDIQSALKLFGREIEELRRHISVVTVAPHGSPLSRWDSLRIWDHAERADFGLMGDAYLDIDFSNTIYLTDTGRTWAETDSNLRDRPTMGRATGMAVCSTDDLISELPFTDAVPICIQTHPERWNRTLRGYLRSWLLDLGANGIKRLIRTIWPEHIRNREGS